jgi:sodium-dependent dicarboxylate transporter 2/3/5
VAHDERPVTAYLRPVPAPDQPAAPQAPADRRQQFFIVAGPLAWLLLRWLAPATLPPAAADVLGVAGWMAVWWLSEAVPLGVTSLLPLVLFPLLGATSAKEAAAPFANELVFLFLGGFLLAAALERWNAHARIAYGIVGAMGVGARRTVLGVMVATAFISMWISNTATAAMMFPIALAIGSLFGDGVDARRTRTALMLGVAYAASIGGMATLIGTPPNLIFAGAAEQLTGQRVGFVEFMAFGLPVAALLLPITWALLVFVLFRARVESGDAVKTLFAERRRALGRLGGGERRVLVVFGLTALAWLLREPKVFDALTVPGLATFFPGITDATIAIGGAVLLFVVPGREPTGARRPLLTWPEARHISWETLLLFGGGLSLAAAMESTGLAGWLGGQMTGLAGLPTPMIYAGLATLVLVLSEIGSNTAVAAMMLPVAASLAAAVGEPPLTLMLVATLAASTGFALPIATPPNAIVFGSGQVSTRDMARAGLILDAIAIVLVTLVVWLL